jgi:hypothetical protein
MSVALLSPCYVLRQVGYMQIKAAFFALALLALSGCDSDLQLSRKSDVELCVEAHIQAAYEEDVWLKEMTATDEETSSAAYVDIEKIAKFHLLCLRAAAGK